jgi:hypothetical protein
VAALDRQEEATAMAMTIKVRKNGKVCILEISGKTTLGERTKRLRE